MARRTLVVTALALALGASADVAQAADLSSQRGTIWVTNRTLNTATVHRGATGEVLATIPVGADPSDVAVPHRSSKAYVANEADNSITMISRRTLKVIGSLAVGARPHHVEASRDGRLVVFGEFGTNRVGVIDTTTDTVTEYVANGNAEARTHQAYPSRDGGTVFAISEGANELSAIDRMSGRITFTVPMGNRPSEVLVTPNGKWAYVSVRGEDKVKLVHVPSRSVTGEVAVGTQPDTLQLTPDERTLIVALRGQPAQIVFVDARSFTASAPLTVAGDETTAAHQFLSANGRFTFVAFEGPGAGVAVVDNEARKVAATYPAPTCRPSDMYCDPMGGRPHGIYYADPYATAGPQIAVRSRSAEVDRERVARIAVRCGAETVVECRGRLKLAARDGTELGRGSFLIPANRTETVRVGLARRGFEAVAEAGRLRARAAATASDRLDNSRSASRTITLRAPDRASR